jgi:hypothetical protein
MSTTALSHLPGFLDDVLYQAEWRARKAAKYPDDERNQNAADHLKALHAWLRRGAPEDLLVALDYALGRLYADPDVNLSFQPGVTDRLGRLGFYRVNDPSHQRWDVTRSVPTRVPEGSHEQFDAEMIELIKAINEHLEPAPETIEDRLTAAATDYVETIKELEEEYLEEKRLAFYEAAEEEDSQRDGDDKKDEMAERWQEQSAEDKSEFFEMVKEAEVDAWRS